MKVRSAIFAVSAIVALAGCGREVVVVQMPASTTTTTTDAPVYDAPATIATVAPQYSDEEMYLASVKSETSLGLYVADTDILELGYTICDFLSAGGTAADLAEMIYTAGVNSGASDETMMDYASLSGIAVAWLCPSQSWKL